MTTRTAVLTILIAAGLTTVGHAGILACFESTGRTTMTIARPRSELTSAALVIRNTSRTSSVTVRVSSRTVPDLSTYDRILAETQRLSDGKTTESLARSAYDMVSRFREYNWTSATGDDECHDPVKLMNVYGYGLCDDSARALATVWQGLGIQSRVWDLYCHVVPEYGDRETSHVLDPDMRVHAYEGETSKTRSVHQMWADPSQLQPAEVPDGTAAQELRDRLVRALDRRSTGTRPRPAVWNNVANHDAGIHLRPGESLLRYARSDLGYYSKLDGKTPPRYANAVFDWERELPPEVLTDDDVAAFSFRTRLPFVLVRGTVELRLHEPSPFHPRIEASRDGIAWDDCPLESARTSRSLETLRFSLPESLAGTYEVIVRVADAEDFEGLPLQMTYRQKLVTQCSPTTFPAIESGDGNDEIYVDADDFVPLSVVFAIETGAVDEIDDYAVLTVGDPDFDL